MVRALPRRVKHFARGNPRHRQNPASLRRLYYDTVVNDFESSCTETAEALTNILKGASQSREHRRLFTGEVVYRVLRDDQAISYNQIDALALHYRVPMALLLLFSRIRSEVEDGPGHSILNARRVVDSFRAALDALETIVREAPGKLDDVYDYLDHQKFLSIQQAYLRVFEREPSLFGDDPPASR